MKKITAIIPFFLFCSAWASEDCKNRAQTFVEIREDYKNLAELRADLKVSQAHNDIIRQLGGASAAEDGRIQLMELYGPFVFNYYKGLNSHHRRDTLSATHLRFTPEKFTFIACLASHDLKERLCALVRRYR